MEYKKLSGLTIALTVLIACNIVLIFIMPVFQHLFFSYFYGHYMTALYTVVVQIPKHGAFLAFIVVLSIWMYRGAHNLRYFNATQLQFTPPLAAGSIFIPFVNTVLPFLIINEILTAAQFPQSVEKRRISPLIIISCAFFVLFAFISFISMVLSYSLPYIYNSDIFFEYMELSSMSFIFSALYIGSSLCYIVATVLIAVITFNINKIHTMRHEGQI